MATPKTSETHYQTQQRLGAVAAGTANRLWSRMNEDFDAAYRRIEPDLLAIVTAGQEAAARTGAQYISAVLYETEQVDLAAGDIIPAAFAGTASDGRSLTGLLRGSVVKAKEAVGNGVATEAALAQGGRWLTMTVLTALADANREANQAAIGMRPAVSGFVRMLNPPSCSRCAILAGKWFRWNQGFQRHPRCDCRHIPASENLAGDLTTDPYEYFRSLTAAEQDKAFGRIEARAIRDGGDIYRVVNISGKRGLGTAKSAMRYGTPSRMTVDDIYRVAGTRTNAIRILEREGYITGLQVGGGNIFGQREGFGELGRGGTRVGATNAARAARASGERDPRNRYTMTAAERRLFDADVMMQSVRSGRNPWLKGRPLTEADRALAQRIFDKQLADLPNQPEQVRELARLLGLI